MTYLSIQKPIPQSPISSSLIKSRNIDTRIVQMFKSSSNFLYDDAPIQKTPSGVFCIGASEEVKMLCFRPRTVNLFPYRTNVRTMSSRVPPTFFPGFRQLSAS